MLKFFHKTAKKTIKLTEQNQVDDPGRSPTNSLESVELDRSLFLREIVMNLYDKIQPMCSNQLLRLWVTQNIDHPMIRSLIKNKNKFSDLTKELSVPESQFYLNHFFLKSEYVNYDACQKIILGNEKIISESNNLIFEYFGRLSIEQSNYPLSMCVFTTKFLCLAWGLKDTELHLIDLIKEPYVFLVFNSNGYKLKWLLIQSNHQNISAMISQDMIVQRAPDIQEQVKKIEQLDIDVLGKLTNSTLSFL